MTDRLTIMLVSCFLAGGIVALTFGNAFLRTDLSSAHRRIDVLEKRIDTLNVKVQELQFRKAER